MFELVTSRPSAFLPFTSVVRLNDRNVFPSVGATHSQNQIQIKLGLCLYLLLHYVFDFNGLCSYVISVNLKFVWSITVLYFLRGVHEYRNV